MQHELLVLDRADKETRDGKPFARLVLGNATGRIETAPVWSEQLSWVAGADKGKVVQVIGTVGEYQGKRQLTLSAPVRVLPASAASADQFLPRIARKTEELWAWVDQQRSAFASRTLRISLDLFFADDVFRQEFERAPGSTTGHHAQVGGLLLHSVEVASIAQGIARTMHANVELVTVAALLHDIGKVEAYHVSATGFGHTAAGHLLGHVVLGSLMLDRRLRTLPAGTLSSEQELELQHFIQSHHGSLEFGAAVQPMTLEAEILHWADQASAKAADVTDTLANDEHFGDDAFTLRRPWPVQKRLWRRPHGWE
ncbi:MAG: HD domain-containing protein [Gemmatimonadaceae bacterium]|nr:HD domain-containing protein [Gemmatimonadaceae bacterium]